jgi:hypothetical protein
MASAGTKTPKKLTKRQQDILMLVYKFRFLDRTHVQALLGHKDKKTINMWLRDLKERNYLEWSYSKKFIENTKPAVYYSSLGAIRYLKTREDVNENILRSLYRDGTRSQDFRSRKLIAAEIAAWASQRGGYEFLTPPSYLVGGNQANFLTNHRVEPDLILVRQKTRGYLVLILGYSWPRWRVMTALRAYIDLYLSNAWEDKMGLSFPKIVVVGRSRGQMGEVRRHVKRLLEAQENPEDLQFAFAFEPGAQASKVKAILS